MKYVSKQNLELFAAELKKQGGSSKASEIDTESATAGQLLGTDGSGNTEWESPMTDEDVDMLFIEKGTILKMNLDGTERQYRVLKKVRGSVVEVLTQFDPFGDTNKRYNETSTTDTFADGSIGQKYAGSNLDTSLNTTWYNTLSSTAKEAIVDKNIIQDMWYGNSASGDPDYYCGTYHVSLKGGATLAVGNRHVYCISVQDVIDYLEVTPQMTSSDTTWTEESIREMFGHSSSTSLYYWFSSASASAATGALTCKMNSAKVEHNNYNTGCRVRPAFCIDLSKITYTEV